MEPIRVLHILQRMEAAGIQTLLMNLYRVIDRNKVQFDFLVQYKEKNFYDDEIEAMGGKIYKLSVREDYNVLKYRKELRKFFAEHKEYKVVHGHMETLSNIWEEEAKRAQIPTVIVHSHIAGFNEKNLLKLLIKEYYRFSYGRYADEWFACSRAAGDFMFPNKDYKVIHNAIDTRKFVYTDAKREMRAKLGLKDEFVVGHVGRFHPQKNHMFLVNIAEKLEKIIPNMKIMLIGDGDLRSEIEEEIEKKKLNKFFMILGNRQDVNILYSAMDAFVLPSLYEGLPLVGVEAQAAGLNCFFSNTVTDEVKITDRAHFIQLDAGAQVWAEKIAESKKDNRKREGYADIVAHSGYDIYDLADKLSKFYISAYEEIKDA